MYIKKREKKKVYKSKTNKQKDALTRISFCYSYQTRSGCITRCSLPLFAVRRQSADELRTCC